MRTIAIVFVALAGLVAVLAVANDVEATTVCHSTNHWCQGYAHVSTTVGGTASARCAALRLTNTAPTCSVTTGITPINEAGWQLDPGACLTFYYFETTVGLVPPASPNKVTVAAVLDTIAGVIRTYKDGTVPPDPSGTSYQFCATSDGTATGSPRGGTAILYLRIIKDNGNGLPGNTNYNVHSDGGLAGTLTYDRGVIRVSTFVTAITRNAYESGSTYAYGFAAPESITITATFTQPFGDVGTETARLAVVDEATLAVGAVGATVDVDGTSLQQSFTVDSTFPSASSPYVGAFEVVGNSATTGNVKWTFIATTGHCGTCVRTSDLVVYNSADFNVNPDISFDADGTGTPDNVATVKLTTCSGAVLTVANRGETVCAAWYLINARGQQLTRAMTFTTEDATAVACTSHGSLTPTAGLYSVTWAIPTGGSCAVANTLAGAPRYMRATNTDQIEVSASFLGVSTLYTVDAHTQVSATLGSQVTEFYIRSDGAGGDASDTVRLFCHVQGVRGDLNIDTTGSAVTRSLIDPASVTRATGTTDTAADGWAPALTLLATTPLGTWDGTCSVSFQGNTGTNTQEFTIGLEEAGGETIYTGADPLTIFAHQPNNGTVPVAIHSRFLNGEARVGAASSIFVSAFDWPSMSPVVTDQAVTEVSATDAPGGYAYAFTAPYAGAFLLAANTTDGATPIGAFTVITVVDYSGNFSSLEAELMHETTFASLTGFTGTEFLFILALALAGILVWSRSTDPAVRGFAAALPMIAGVLVILLALEVGVGALWLGAIGFGAILILVGGYLVVRLFLDYWLETPGASA